MTDLTVTLIGENLLMTALLIAAVLVLRRPVAMLLGARMAYALWIIPALRLVLPPLPGGETVVAAPSAAPLMLAAEPILREAAAPTVFEQVTPWLPALWLVGALTVLGLALVRHHRWLREVRRQGTPLDAIDGVGVVMSDHVDGPVATGLWRPMIVVPADFFASYNQTERHLALAHELAHHRAGDLWANAAALIVLAAQWFNPLAWRAVREFRFDQEAACDARVLAGLEPDAADQHTHSYARAIAKSVAGPRLLLAAPMTSGTKVKERLQMLTHNPRLGLRPGLSRLLLGGATIAALALTVSSLPARTVYAAEPTAPPEAPAPPAPPAPPVASEPHVSHVVMIERDGNVEGGEDGADKKVQIHRIVLHGGRESAGEPSALMRGGKPDEALAVAVNMVASGRGLMPMFGTNHDDLRATLAEQGIDGAKADAVIKSLDQKRSEALARARAATNHARLSIVPLIPGSSGFPMTEGTYLKLRALSVPAISEKELLERTLNAMTAARESFARKVGGGEARDPGVLDALDREIEHLKGKIKRF